MLMITSRIGYASFRLWKQHLSPCSDAKVRVIISSCNNPMGGKHVFKVASYHSYMDATFVLLAHERLEIRTNQSCLFTQVGLLQLQRD